MEEQLSSQQSKFRLPLAANLYYIELSGKITDNQGNEILQFYNNQNDPCVNIAWIDGYRSYRVADIMALTFKPVNIPYYRWKDIWVIFKDGNNLNSRPSNLIWKFPNTGIESNVYKDYFYIPNFTRYLINKEGNVIHSISHKPLNGSVRDKGYIYYALSPDIKSKKSIVIGRHRLLAIVFLDYNENVDSLDVNHINGIPGDDRIDNLEWVTRKENIKHAFLNNLRQDNKSVIVVNHNTGEVTRYYSAHECGRCLGLGKAVVHWRIKKSPGKIFPPGLSFKYENDNYEKCGNKHFGIKLKMTDTKTNSIRYFNSILQCSIFLKISKKVIQKRLKNNTIIFYKDFIFEKVNTY